MSRGRSDQAGMNRGRNEQEGCMMDAGMLDAGTLSARRLR